MYKVEVEVSCNPERSSHHKKSFVVPLQCMMWKCQVTLRDPAVTRSVCLFKTGLQEQG